MNLQDANYVKWLTDAGIKACKVAVQRVNDEIKDDPDTALEPLRIGRRLKRALRIDASAEDNLKAAVKAYKSRVFRKISFYGEESLKDTSLDLAKTSGVCALMDAVDGTDLVERGLGNWCSDVVFFAPGEPEGKRILASIVTLPNGDTYYASRDAEGAFAQKRGNGKKPMPMTSISKCRCLREASVCFYGQKVNNLNSTNSTKIWESIASLEPDRSSKDSQPITTRIYNLAGVPMMMKLIDPIGTEAHGIDAVFDIAGQQPHDVVPGAYIALKAGAFMKQLNGRKLGLPDLEEALFKPAAMRIRYVLAGTESLCDEIIQAIGITTARGLIIT